MVESIGRIFPEHFLGASGNCDIMVNTARRIHGDEAKLPEDSVLIRETKRVVVDHLSTKFLLVSPKRSRSEKQPLGAVKMRENVCPPRSLAVVSLIHQDEVK